MSFGGWGWWIAAFAVFLLWGLLTGGSPGDCGNVYYC